MGCHPVWPQKLFYIAWIVYKNNALPLVNLNNQILLRTLANPLVLKSQWPQYNLIYRTTKSFPSRNSILNTIVLGHFGTCNSLGLQLSQRRPQSRTLSCLTPQKQSSCCYLSQSHCQLGLASCLNTWGYPRCSTWQSHGQYIPPPRSSRNVGLAELVFWCHCQYLIQHHQE